MSLSPENYCKRCARKMETQIIGRDEEGKAITIKVCHCCQPDISGAREHYEMCTGWISGRSARLPQRRRVPGAERQEGMGRKDLDAALRYRGGSGVCVPHRDDGLGENP